MLVHNNKFVLTGGSSVVKGYWNSIAFPEENSQGFWTKRQREISKLFADYLLATGKIGQGFGYFAYKDILIIQSRIDSHDEPQEHIFSTSLLKLLVDFPDHKFLVKTPFDRETSISIRHRIMGWISNLSQPISSDPSRLLFTK